MTHPPECVCAVCSFERKVLMMKDWTPVEKVQPPNLPLPKIERVATDPDRDYDEYIDSKVDGRRIW